jgi:hypothetical protein
MATKPFLGVKGPGWPAFAGTIITEAAPALLVVAKLGTTGLDPHTFLRTFSSSFRSWFTSTTPRSLSA